MEVKTLADLEKRNRRKEEWRRHCEIISEKVKKNAIRSYLSAEYAKRRIGHLYPENKDSFEKAD